MKAVLKRIFILLGVFLGSVVFFMFVFNRQETTKSQKMAEPTLPVLYMQESGTDINQMCGYKQEMSESTVRDCLTLLPADRNLTLGVQSYGHEITDVDYQLSSLEDGSILENGRVKSFEQTEDALTASFHINTPITMGQEYMLRFSLNLENGDTVYYYTRLIQRNGQNLSWYLEYVKAFYQSCINNTLTDDILSQLETESSSSNSSLHCVSLKSDKDQIAWGSLQPTLAKEAVPTILEINENTVSIRQDYVILAQDENGVDEYYTVQEYYRMRKSQDQVVLLDFERTATQIFDGKGSVLTEDSLNLGITGKDEEYVSNDSANMVAFVQAGELWLYDRDANKVSRIFSFRGDDPLDERTSGDNYGITVSTVDENGDTTFIVYGYRPAGTHEGSVGISIYRYDAQENISSELIFIPLEDSYQMENQGLSKLAYVNSADQCFLYYNKQIYTIRITDGAVNILQDNLDWQKASVSDSQMLVAWSENEEKSVQELNLETGETISINAPDGDDIKALGYVGEDMIYGLVHESDCYTDSTGNTVFPIYRVCIRSQGGDLQKDYQVDGIYVTGVEIDGDLITLKRASFSDGKLQATSDDQLIHYAPEEDRAVELTLNVSSRQGTQVYLEFSSQGESSNLLSLDARYEKQEEEKNLTVSEMKYNWDGYYVYAKGGLYGIYDSINEAIGAADQEVGVVLNSKQQYVWERGNTQTTAMLDIETLPQGLLSAPINEEAIAQVIGEDYNVWNLSACSLSSIYYQLSNGYPVIGQWTEEENLLIIGYDQYNIWYYDSSTGQAKAIVFEDAQAQFAAMGNVFISYHEK